MFHPLVKSLLLKACGLLIFILGAYAGIIMLFGDELWQRGAIVRYGGQILAIAVIALGVKLMTYKT